VLADAGLAALEGAAASDEAPSGESPAAGRRRESATDKGGVFNAEP